VACCKSLETQIAEHENDLHKLTQVRNTILGSCHANALPVIKHSFAVIEAAWHHVSIHARIACLSELARIIEVTHVEHG